MANVIQDKSRAFAIRIINCYKYLDEEKHERIMSKQLLRCGTSIGANTRESKNAQSRTDFLSKLNKMPGGQVIDILNARGQVSGICLN